MREFYWGVGRRKTAIARVRLFNGGKGNIWINGRPFENYFVREDHRQYILKPLEVTHLKGKVDVKARINGGGITGQAGALRLGIARAILAYDPDMRNALKAHGLLTRDPRIVERKKYGQHKARKKYQYHKR